MTQSEFDWTDESTEPKTPVILKCRNCGKELSEYLDKYWGKDQWWSQFCAKCQPKK